ncbi:ISAs1 family transposase [Tepidanaerobacter acetatoxydans]|nr:ISAs1 family transposase [Tepidanaerobacter acetatoxydans]
MEWTQLIANIINKGDYVLALKGNHPLLHKEIEEFSKEAEDKKYQKKYGINTYQNYDKGHGRIERRTYYIASNICWLDARKEWKKLTSIGMVKYYSEQNGKKTCETRYYLCNIEPDATKFANAEKTLGHRKYALVLRCYIQRRFNKSKKRQCT